MFKTFVRLVIAAAAIMMLILICGCECEHEFGEWTEKTAPTCSAEGTELRTCTKCGESEERAIATLAHKWKAATCQTPKTCEVCGKTEGVLADHKWKAATCQTPKTCEVCGKTEGKLADHDWEAATCQKPKTCKVCGKTEGELADHDWEAATCQKPKTCKVCGKTEGGTGEHVWSTDGGCTSLARCTVCGATSGIGTGHSAGLDLICTKCGEKVGDSTDDFVYYAVRDFHRIRDQYPTAEAQGAYVTLSTVQQGDEGEAYMVSVVMYKIISNYIVTTLHNLTTGETVEDPVAHYKRLADNYYGAERILMMDKANSYAYDEKIALENLRDIIQSGNVRNLANYVSPDILNK